MPLSGSFWGLFGALSMRLTAAFRLPVAEGVKVTLIRQPLLGGIESGQLLVWEKSLRSAPVIPIDLMVRVALPEWVRVEICGVLAMPTVWLPKFRAVGDDYWWRGVNTVVTISNASAYVTLSKVTIRNGLAAVGHCGFYLCAKGGGIYNSGTLTVLESTISGNVAFLQEKSCTFYTTVPSCLALGGGIYNSVGTLTISKSTITGNVANVSCLYKCSAAGGAILNGGSVTINNSTISGNNVLAFSKYLSVSSFGGGISNNTSTALTSLSAGMAHWAMAVV
jgi:hypothetical protein